MMIPNITPPHVVIAVTVPEVQQALAKTIAAHLELCADCRAWAEEHSDDWHRWVVERRV